MIRNNIQTIAGGSIDASSSLCFLILSVINNLPRRFCIKVIKTGRHVLRIYGRWVQSVCLSVCLTCQDVFTGPRAPPVPTLSPADRLFLCLFLILCPSAALLSLSASLFPPFEHEATDLLTLAVGKQGRRFNQCHKNNSTLCFENEIIVRNDVTTADRKNNTSTIIYVICYFKPRVCKNKRRCFPLILLTTFFCFCTFSREF